LSTNYVRKTFNHDNPDDSRVEYYSYAGYTQSSRHVERSHIDVVTPLLLAAHKLTKILEGDNDGLVSDTSARWGTYLGRSCRSLG